MTARSPALATALAGLLLAAAPLVAQTPRLRLPADPLVRLSFDGTEALRTRFTDTRLAKLLRSPQVAAMTGNLGGLLQSFYEEGSRETGADLEAVGEVLLGHRGRVHVFLDLADGFALGSDEAPPFRGAVVFAPDGRSDLRLVAEEVAVAFDAMDDPDFLTLEFGGLPWRMVGEREAGALAGLTMPTMVDDHLVMAFGWPLEGAIGALLAEEPQGVQGDGGKGFELEVRLGDVMKQMQSQMTELGEAAGQQEMGMMENVLASLGLFSMRSLGVTVDAVDDHLVVESTLGLMSKEGLWAFYGGSTSDLQGLDLVPAGVDVWSVGNIGLDHAHGMIRAVIEQTAPVTGMTMAVLEEEFEFNTGVRLKEDLLDVLGNEIVTLMDRSYLERLLEDEVDGVAYAVRLRGPARMKQTLQTMLGSAGLKEMVQTGTAHGAEVSTLDLGDFLVEWSIQGEYLLIGAGAKGSTLMRAALEQMAKRAAGEPRGAFAPQVEERLPYLHAERSQMQVVDVTAFFGLARGAFRELYGPAPEELGNTLAFVEQLLREHGLQHVVITATTTDTGLAARIVW